MAHQLPGHPARRVDRHREAQALRRGDHRRVHADDLGRAVQQRAARVAGVERYVGLDHVLDHPPAARGQAAAQCAHDAGGDGEVEPQRVADGNGKLARQEACRTPERQEGAGVRLDAQHRDVCRRVEPDQARHALGAVGEGGADIARALDHVRIGERKTVGREEEAGAAALRACIAALRRPSDLDVRDGCAGGVRHMGDGGGVGVVEEIVA